jgi:hypothetical protein
MAGQNQTFTIFQLAVWRECTGCACSRVRSQA